jgi:hypothetical protein
MIAHLILGFCNGIHHPLSSSSNNKLSQIKTIFNKVNNVNKVNKNQPIECTRTSKETYPDIYTKNNGNLLRPGIFLFKISSFINTYNHYFNFINIDTYNHHFNFISINTYNHQFH